MTVNTQTLEAQHTSGVYAKRDLVIVRGRGALVWDEQGNEYIDCAAGHGVANLGHCHPAVVAAITEQAQRLITCPEVFYNDRRAALMERLSSLGPQGMRRVFLCNSGAEAVEGAFKFARFSSGRTNFVACLRAFHGRTFGALSATYNKKYREPFEPLLPGFQHVPYNNLEKLDAAVDENTAGVILEVVQGEGGVHAGTREFLLGAQEICRQRGALLIIDEVQTGFGRTGKLFASQHHGLQPDLLCLAKSLAGGVPIGALLIGERVREIPVGIHGSTFGGNPLAAAAGLAALDAIEKENLCERSAELGEYFLKKLDALDAAAIREVRGIGLMIGVETRQKVAPYIGALKERGILALNAGPTVLRFLPPLVIKREQIDQIVEAVDDVLTNVRGEE